MADAHGHQRRIANRHHRKKRLPAVGYLLTRARRPSREVDPTGIGVPLPVAEVPIPARISTKVGVHEAPGIDRLGAKHPH